MEKTFYRNGKMKNLRSTPVPSSIIVPLFHMKHDIQREHNDIQKDAAINAYRDLSQAIRSCKMLFYSVSFHFYNKLYIETLNIIL